MEAAKKETTAALQAGGTIITDEIAPEDLAAFKQRHGISTVSDKVKAGARNGNPR